MGKYDRYNSAIKRALRQGDRLKAVKLHMGKPENFGKGLYEAKKAVEEIGERIKPRPKLNTNPPCPICGYENLNGQCPRCLMYTTSIGID